MAARGKWWNPLLREGRYIRVPATHITANNCDLKLDYTNWRSSHPCSLTRTGEVDSWIINDTRVTPCRIVKIHVCNVLCGVAFSRKRFQDVCEKDGEKGTEGTKERDECLTVGTLWCTDVTTQGWQTGEEGDTGRKTGRGKGREGKKEQDEDGEKEETGVCESDEGRKRRVVRGTRRGKWWGIAVIYLRCWWSDVSAWFHDPALTEWGSRSGHETPVRRSGGHDLHGGGASFSSADAWGRRAPPSGRQSTGERRTWGCSQNISEG